jgi:hypothetical protein
MMSIKGLFNSAATLSNGKSNDISESFVIIQDSDSGRVGCSFMNISVM